MFWKTLFAAKKRPVKLAMVMPIAKRSNAVRHRCSVCWRAWFSFMSESSPCSSLRCGARLGGCSHQPGNAPEHPRKHADGNYHGVQEEIRPLHGVWAWRWRQGQRRQVNGHAEGHDPQCNGETSP